MVQLTGPSWALAIICCIWARMAIICPGVIREGSTPLIRTNWAGSTPDERRAATASPATSAPKRAESICSMSSKGSSLMGFLSVVRTLGRLHGQGPRRCNTASVPPIPVREP